MPDKGVRYPKCPHCGGQHWGQRFDDCPYVALLSDLTATKEQRANAADHIANHRRFPPQSSAGGNGVVPVGGDTA
jgi:hypothetical protein